MKKSNQKIMLGFTIFFGILAIWFLFQGIVGECITAFCSEKVAVFVFGLILGIIFISLGIITWAKWGSEGEHKEKKEEKVEEAEVEIGKIRVKAKKKR